MKEQKELPTLEFEGKKIVPKNGYYRCPFKCGDPRYPTQKWKTDDGFKKHMDKCPKRPSLLQKKKEDADDRKQRLDILKKLTLESGIVPYQVGQTIHYVREVVVKPTHEMRFNRMVRVRYEAVKSFSPQTVTVNSIDFEDIWYNEPKTIEEMLKVVVLNGHINPSTICSTFEEAKNKAKKEQESYDNWLKECSSYR